MPSMFEYLSLFVGIALCFTFVILAVEKTLKSRKYDKFLKEEE